MHESVVGLQGKRVVVFRDGLIPGFCPGKLEGLLAVCFRGLGMARPREKHDQSQYGRSQKNSAREKFATRL